jgi:hypothetical protein
MKKAKTEELNPGHYDQAADRAACLGKMIKDFLQGFEPIAQDAQHTARVAIAADHIKAVELQTQPLSTGNVPLDDRAAWLCEAVSDLLVEQLNNDKKAHRMAYSAMCRLWALFQYLAEQQLEQFEEANGVYKTKSKNKKAK